ncbi:MAG: hypothetical protein QXS17_03575 [Candidatus Micrarchaeaceae archaeon]
MTAKEISVEIATDVLQEAQAQEIITAQQQLSLLKFISNQLINDAVKMATKELRVKIMDVLREAEAEGAITAAQRIELLNLIAEKEAKP